MGILADAVIAALAAIGLAAVLYLAARALAKRSELSAPVYLILPVSGKTKELEEAVAALQWLRREYGGAARAAVLDCGMEGEQRRMTRILQREDPLLLVLTEETLLKELRGGQ